LYIIQNELQEPTENPDILDSSVCYLEFCSKYVTAGKEKVTTEIATFLQME
jgi:hypothetical protein